MKTTMKGLRCESEFRQCFNIGRWACFGCGARLCDECVSREPVIAEQQYVCLVMSCGDEVCTQIGREQFEDAIAGYDKLEPWRSPDRPARTRPLSLR